MLSLHVLSTLKALNYIWDIAKNFFNLDVFKQLSLYNYIYSCSYIYIIT